MEYADTVLPVMRELRAILIPKWGTAEIVRRKTDRPVSIVSSADIEAEEHTARRLHALYPDIPFVGEERGGDRNSARFWLMDPIDGTEQFVHGESECTSMLALIEDGHVRFSAIYDFLNDTMYWAGQGEGAYCEKTRLVASKKEELEGATIVWEMRVEKGDNQRRLDELNAVARLVRWKTAGYELARLACGDYDARICMDPYGSDYDYAAGSLLVSEAGGTVINIAAAGYDYRNLNFYAGSPYLAHHFDLGASASFPPRTVNEKAVLG